MRITAPSVDREVVFRVFFPLTNYTAVNLSGNLSVQQSERTVLQYKRENLRGAATCVEGYMAYQDQRDVVLFRLENGGDLGPSPIEEVVFGRG